MSNTLRKIFIAVVLLTAMNAEAQISLGDILGKVKDSVSGQNESNKKDGGDLISAITGVFSKNKIATKDRIVGTWNYEAPAIVFTSDNVLKKAGGKMFSSLMEKKLQERLEKYGIVKGVVSITFNEDSTFVQELKGKTLKSTYSIEEKNIVMKYGGKISQLVGTTQLDGDNLLIVMDMSKLLKYVDALKQYTSNSSIKTAMSLLGSMDGMECGLMLKRQ